MNYRRCIIAMFFLPTTIFSAQEEYKFKKMHRADSHKTAALNYTAPRLNTTYVQPISSSIIQSGQSATDTIDNYTSTPPKHLSSYCCPSIDCYTKYCYDPEGPSYPGCGVVLCCCACTCIAASVTTLAILR
jgi:hypothetical protein